MDGALAEFFDPAILDFLRDTEEELSSSEFRKTSETELKYLKDLNSNCNTTSSTQTWLRRYIKWATARGFPTDFKLIPKAELDSILQQFYAELVKQNGDDYEPESLKVMIAALDRTVREICGYSILKDKDFVLSRKVLNGKAISLQKSGKGKRPNKADAITSEEEEILWSTVLGKDNPKSLNYTTFFLLGQHFGTRGCQEHHQLKVEDLKLTKEPVSGKVIEVEWVEGPTKTRQGGLNKRLRPVTQKLFRVGGPKCPIACLEKVLSKRPDDLCDNGPLYLCPLKRERDWLKAPVWYSRCPLGINSINSFIKGMTEAAGLDTTNKHFTNHSIRKTTVQKLKKAGVAPTDIVAITGHTNQQSLSDYGELDQSDHQRIGKILSSVHDQSTSSQVQLARPSVSAPALLPPQPLVPSAPATAIPPPYSGPVYNFNNSTVYFLGSSTSNTCNQEYKHTVLSQQNRKRCNPLEYDIDHDEECD